jgi:flagellar biosynthetic protein FliO
VTINSKKVVTIIAAAVLFTAPFALAQKPEDLNQTQQPDLSELLTKHKSADIKDPNFTFSQNGQLNTRQMFMKMMLAVFMVLFLGIAVVYISKKLGGRIANAPGKEIQMLETLYLGSRKSIHLIKISNRRIVIGCTTDRITKLAEMPDETEQPDKSSS